MTVTDNPTACVASLPTRTSVVTPKSFGARLDGANALPQTQSRALRGGIDVYLPGSASLLPWEPVGRRFGSSQTVRVARSHHHNRMTSNRLLPVPEILNPPYPPRLDPLILQFLPRCVLIRKRYPVRFHLPPIRPSQIPFLRTSDSRCLPSMIGRA